MTGQRDGLFFRTERRWRAARLMSTAELRRLLRRLDDTASAGAGPLFAAAQDEGQGPKGEGQDDEQ